MTSLHPRNHTFDSSFHSRDYLMMDKKIFANVTHGSKTSSIHLCKIHCNNKQNYEHNKKKAAPLEITRILQQRQQDLYIKWLDMENISTKLSNY